MRTDLKKSAKKMVTRRTWYKRWQKLVSSLAIVTVFCTTYSLILPAITVTAETFCGHEEHKHTEECYTRQLVCGLEESEGTEAETITKEVVTTETETVLVDEGHTHGDDCYETNTVLICGEEETPHQDAVIDEETGEVIEEAVEGHTHTDACYTEETNLVCGEEEREPVYEEQEIEEVTTEVVEGQKAVEGHKHTDECYEEVLTCDKVEHEHDDECFVDKNADIESRSDWEKTLPANLNGNWRENTLRIAQSQVGYQESTTNYIVQGGEKKGYTRYGDMMGIPYGDWCAMFLQFSLHYAGVDSSIFPGSPNVPQWVRLAAARNNFYSPANYTPQAGDIVYFDWDVDGSADHIGIVEQVEMSGSKAVSITTIEGNSSNMVRRNAYNISNKNLYGYTIIPESAEGQESIELDFSSMRLIAGTEDTSIFAEEEYVVAVSDDVYLLQMPTIEETIRVYKFYLDKVDFVTPDVALVVADDEDIDPEEAIITTENVYTEADNPFAEVKAALTSDVSKSVDVAEEEQKNDTRVIALIDTGATLSDNVIDRTSVIGDNTGDDNGHGDKMAAFMVSQNPDAKIISIKAIDKYGIGDVSAVIAAIQYAVERDVDIINLSVCAYASEDNAALADAINKAVEADVAVIGSAGNQGFNAKYYIPGKIEDAIIVGSCDERGHLIDKSNFGKTVDYNVVSSSTSEAAALLSGFVSLNGVEGIADVLDQGFIFSADFDGDFEPTDKDDALTVQDGVSSWDELKDAIDRGDQNITINGSIAAYKTIEIPSGYTGTISGGTIYRKADARFGSMFMVASGANVTFDSVDFDGRSANETSIATADNNTSGGAVTFTDKGIKVKNNGWELVKNGNSVVGGTPNGSNDGTWGVFQDESGFLKAQNDAGDDAYFLVPDLSSDKGYKWVRHTEFNRAYADAWIQTEINGNKVFYNAANNCFINCGTDGKISVEKLVNYNEGGTTVKPVTSGKGSALTDVSFDKLTTQAYNAEDLDRTGDQTDQFGFFLDIEGDVAVKGTTSFHDANIISTYYDNSTFYKYTRPQSGNILDYSKNSVLGAHSNKEVAKPVYNAAPIAVKGGKLTIESGSITNNYVGYPMYDQAELSERYDYDKIVNHPEEFAFGYASDRAEGGNNLNNGNAHDWLCTNAGDNGVGIMYAAGGSEGLNTGSAGGIIVANGGTVDLNNGTIGGIKNNTSPKEANVKARITGDYNISYVGGVYIKDGTLNQNGGSISDNIGYATGGVRVDKGEYNLHAGNLSNNATWYEGGGATVFDAGTMNMTGGTISGNITTHKGGGIFVKSHNVNLEAGTIENNKAYVFGGGIYVEGSHTGQNYILQIDDGDIHSNTAHYNGGGIWNCATGNVVYSAEHVRMWWNEATGYTAGPAGNRGHDFYKDGTDRTGILTQFIMRESDEWHNELDGWKDYKFERTDGEVALNNYHKYNEVRGSDATDAAPLIIKNNQAFNGGGIGNNGLLYFEFPKVHLNEIEIWMHVTKAYSQGTDESEKKPVKAVITFVDKTNDTEESKSIDLNAGNKWTDKIKLPVTLDDGTDTFDDSWLPNMDADGNGTMYGKELGKFSDSSIWESATGKWEIRITELDSDGSKLAGYTMDLSKLTIDSVSRHVVNGSGATVIDTKRFDLFTTMTNTPIINEAKVRILKVDAGDETTPLEGAKFTLTGEGIEPLEVVTDATGHAELGNLKPGEYTLTETKAPAGYNKLNEPVIIKVDKDGKVTYKHLGKTFNGETMPIERPVDDDQDNDKIEELDVPIDPIVVKIRNSSGVVLPNTGGTGTTIYTLAGLLLMVTAGASLMYKKLRRKEVAKRG